MFSISLRFPAGSSSSAAADILNCSFDTNCRINASGLLISCRVFEIEQLREMQALQGLSEVEVAGAPFGAPGWALSTPTLSSSLVRGGLSAYSIIKLGCALFGEKRDVGVNGL